MRYQIEKRQHARLFCEKCAAQLIWIFFAGVRHFVEKAFDGEAGVRMAYGTPPLDRHADFWRMQVNLQIRDAVKNVSGTFDGGRVDTVLNPEGFEQGSIQDGLANDGVGPGNGITGKLDKKDLGAPSDSLELS